MKNKKKIKKIQRKKKMNKMKMKKIMKKRKQNSLKKLTLFIKSDLKYKD